MGALFRRVSVVCILLVPLFCAGADDQPPKVEVAAVRNPVEKSYRRMIAGLDLFEANRHLAPQASLRFRLLPRQPDVDMRGIVLKVVGESFATLVPLAADNSFALDRDDRALAEDASVIPNRKRSSMTWRPMVRSPGLAENARRLGDLRLECIVGIRSGLISNHPSPWYQQQMKEQARRGKRACDTNEKYGYLLFADRPLFGVTLRDGSRTETLRFDRLYAGGGNWTEEYLAVSDSQMLLDKTYYAPIADKTWSDNTLIEFSYMDGDPATPDAAAVQPISLSGSKQEIAFEFGKTTKADVSAAMGKSHRVLFRSGYEVWLYVFEKKITERMSFEDDTELVILFDPAGVVKKLRVRKSPNIDK